MYEAGVLAAFLIWLMRIGWMIIVPHTKFSRNLRRVGMCVSWATGRPRPMDEADRSRGVVAHSLRLLLLACMQLPFVLLSWISVGLTLGAFVVSLLRDLGKPQELKAAFWRLRNVELSFDEIVSELYKAQAALGKQGVPFEQFRDAMRHQATGLELG